MAIAKQDYELLFNRVSVALTGASAAGIKAELFDVLSEFFTDSNCWLENISVPIFQDVTTYDLTPTEGKIIRLVAMYDDGGQPIGALMPSIGQIILSNSPNQPVSGLSYTATVAKTVTLPTTKEMIPIGPDWVLPVWHVQILDGVLGRMMIQNAKSYTDKTQGLYHLKRFRDGIARARVATIRQNTLGSQAWRFPAFFGHGSQQTGKPGFGGTDRSF